MASHTAIALLRDEPGPAADLRRVELRLACGCIVRRVIAAGQVIATTRGPRMAVGKYPCPVGHPVRRTTQ
jgi:hypothetical protein